YRYHSTLHTPRSRLFPYTTLFRSGKCSRSLLGHYRITGSTEPYGIPSSATPFITRWRRLTGCWSKAAETSISTSIYHAKHFIMNYIKRLTYFFDKSVADPHFTPTHLSLFMALFQLWNQSRFLPTIQIVRDDVMRLSKINSKATYHKAMGYLHKHRYINYEPSYNPFKVSKISFFPTTTITSAEPVQIL